MSPTEVLCLNASLSHSPRGLKGFHGAPARRMASASDSRRAYKRWSLDDLSSELLVLIFEQLHEIDSRSLALCRTLSPRLNDIITPIKYEYLCLNQRILAPQAETYLPHALENIYVHTRHVQVSNDLDLGRVRHLLDRIQRLDSISWKYATPAIRRDRLWVPADVISPRHLQLKRTRLYVEDLPLRGFDGELRDSYLRAIPTNMLVSLKTKSPAPLLTARLQSLKRLIMSSRNIETFHFDDRGQGTQFSFEEGERFPAFKELLLRSYDWAHSDEEVAQHWDFSRVRVLRLIDVPMHPFLKSVPFASLRDIEALQCEDFSAHLPDRRQEATRGLHALIHQIRSLRSCKITCHTQMFPVDALLSQEHSLRDLLFRDHVGFEDECRRCPTMWVDDLKQLSRRLYHLQTLELDMDVTYCDPALFLQTLCGFPRLDTLTIHVHTVLHAMEPVHPGIDRDYEAAKKMFALLMRGKPAAVPWRSVTINVGGWRPFLVRRMSEAWRAQNEQGVFAERCFQLQRKEDGGMLLRELLPRDSS